MTQRWQLMAGQTQRWQLVAGNCTPQEKQMIDAILEWKLSLGESVEFYRSYSNPADFFAIFTKVVDKSSVSVRLSLPAHNDGSNLRCLPSDLLDVWSSLDRVIAIKRNLAFIEKYNKPYFQEVKIWGNTEEIGPHLRTEIIPPWKAEQ